MLRTMLVLNFLELLILIFCFRCRKPKNARSKRVLDARMPKEIEDARTAIFVKGSHTGETLNAVMRELVRGVLFFHHLKVLIKPVDGPQTT